MSIFHLLMTFPEPDGSSFTVYTEQELGLGQSGIVIRRGEYTLKFAKIRDTLCMPPEQHDVEEYMSHIVKKILQNEKRVYEGVGKEIIQALHNVSNFC